MRFSTFGLLLLAATFSVSLWLIRNWTQQNFESTGKRHYHLGMQGEREETAIDKLELTALLRSTVSLMHEETRHAVGVDGSKAKDESAILSNVIMPPMGNTTVREELGRATWRLLHTMAAKFPQRPSEEQQLSFELFIYLLSRLYPCGNCASHFQLLLTQHPPKLDSKLQASQWMCDTHNIVNTRLEKPNFDCSQALELWQCGCPDQYKH